MINPNKKYRNGLGQEVLAVVSRPQGGLTVLVRDHKSRAPGNPIDFSYQTTDDGLCAADPSYNLIEVKPEVTVRRFVVCSRKDTTDVWTRGDPVPYAEIINIGAIDITHDGAKIVKVEIVNDYAPGAIR